LAVSRQLIFVGRFILGRRDLGSDAARAACSLAGPVEPGSPVAGQAGLACWLAAIRQPGTFTPYAWKVAMEIYIYNDI